MFSLTRDCLCIGNTKQLIPRSRTLLQELPRNTTKLHFVSVFPPPWTVKMILQFAQFLTKEYRGLNRPGSEANHISQFNGKFKIVRMCTSISPTHLHFGRSVKRSNISTYYPALPTTHSWWCIVCSDWWHGLHFQCEVLSTAPVRRKLLTYLLIYLLTYLLTYLHTPWRRFLLEKLTGSQLVKKFPAFYGTWRFITAFTCARHLSLSWASSIQSIPHIPLPEHPS